MAKMFSFQSESTIRKLQALTSLTNLIKTRQQRVVVGKLIAVLKKAQHKKFD